jgi:hypothetical protein
MCMMDAFQLGTATRADKAGENGFGGVYAPALDHCSTAQEQWNDEPLLSFIQGHINRFRPRALAHRPFFFGSRLRVST